jgi:nucleotide-binding universal stress UspA family protein
MSAPIIVGTDFSQAADEALKQAAQAAERHEAPLLVLHVAPRRLFDNLHQDEMEAAVRRALEGRVAASTRVLAIGGSSHAELIAAAEHERAALLVVGASGAGALERAFFGSTAEQVVRHAPCPVLVARKSPEDGPILAATDFSDPAAPAVTTAATEARLRGTPLVLLHSLYEAPSPLAALGPMVISIPASTEGELEALEQAADSTLQTLLEQTGQVGDRVVTRLAPTAAAVAEAKKRQASLIVVGTHGRTGLGRVALGSVAAAIVRQAPCSVLVVRLAEDS